MHVMHLLTKSKDSSLSEVPFEEVNLLSFGFDLNSEVLKQKVILEFTLSFDLYFIFYI